MSVFVFFFPESLNWITITEFQVLRLRGLFSALSGYSNKNNYLLLSSNN